MLVLTNPLKTDALHRRSRKYVYHRGWGVCVEVPGLLPDWSVSSPGAFRSKLEATRFGKFVVNI